MKKRHFGRADCGTVEEITLESADAAVSILNLGCIVRDWRVDGDGRSLPVVLGFRSLEDYLHHSKSHGVIAGRVANRTANSEFTLEGRQYHLTQNEGPHHLHGGVTGLQRRVWEMESDGAAEAVHLSYTSPDGEEGYPGNVAFTVTFRLEGTCLVCEMQGMPDRPTPLNLAQHSYFNLGGGGDVLDHEVWVNSEEYTATGPDLIPDGSLRPVEGTHLDFREPRSIGDSDPERIGLDDNLVLRSGRDPDEAAARVFCPRTGLALELRTREPGLQLFDCAHSEIAVPGHDNTTYGRYAGLCLEAQHFPDSLHQPEFPSIIRSPENPYSQMLKVEIARR